MILHFPTIDVLRLALTSGVIPEAVRGTGVRFGFDGDNSLWLETDAPWSERETINLRRLGVQTPRVSKIEMAQRAANWLQVLPLTRDPRAAEINDEAPVLFELSGEQQLGEVVSEILRLGNDRQSFRWLENDAGDGKTLLRVVGPPYYSLLRAIDREGLEEAAIAYREIAVRVWIQVGYAHLLAEHLKPPAGQMLLLRPPHEWTYVPEGKLRDIYEVIDFSLSDDPSSWRDGELKAHITVPVKLTRGGGEAAELWLLREDGIAQLEELVRSADNELLARFAFAVGEKDAARLVVLRARPSKNAPPVLVLDGLALRSYLRIPNLFVPIGMALYPPLRRQAVMELLARDTSRITWLVPRDDNNSFTPESLPDNAFRPLSEWVDYVLEHEHQAITTWIGATQFEFERFVCKDDQPKEKKPKEPAGPKAAKKIDAKELGDAGGQGPVAKAVEKKKPKKTERVEEETSVKPSELEKRLRELEDAFTTLKTPLDDPARQPIWVEMAEFYGALNQHGDAGICWSNALWEHPHIDVQWPLTWYRLEAKQSVGQTLPTAQIVRIVNADAPTHANLRLLTAHLIWAAAATKTPADLRPHLSDVQRYFEKHEGYLGVRTVWLGWHALHQLAGGDMLMLARARDRLLERLYVHGLTPELDLPGFLRFAGIQSNNRFRTVRDQVVRMRRLVEEWAKSGTNPTPATQAYIDLIFAFGLARLGEAGEAQKLKAEAAEVLQYADDVHHWLYEAFEFRVQQALDGKPGIERLPAKLLEAVEAIEHPEYLAHMEPGDRAKVEQDLRLQRYKIDRLRQYSRILEPHEKIDSYRRWHGRYADELTRELANLTDIADRVELTRRLQVLLFGKTKFKGAPNPQARILVAALGLAPRLGQSFGEEVLDRVTGQLDKLKDAEEKAVLLEKSLFLAAHYDRKEDVQRYVGQFRDLLQSKTALPYDKLIPLFSGSFHSLRKFGLRDAVAQLMQQLGEIVETDRTLKAGATAAMTSGNRGKRLGLLLELASGWFFFGEESKARAILDEARDSLFRKELANVNHVELACAYLTTLGQAPMEFALSRIMEFFRRVEGVYDNWTTISHYSLSRFSVVEAMMLALVSDEFTLDREGLKRLDDDEFLVRRRIHRDVREALAKAGM